MRRRCRAPLPKSTFCFGRSSNVPSDCLMYCMKTELQISAKRPHCNSDDTLRHMRDHAACQSHRKSQSPSPGSPAGIFSTACTDSPILLGIVIEDASSLHAFCVAISLRANNDISRFYPLQQKDASIFLPIRYPVAVRSAHRQERLSHRACGIKSDLLREEGEDPRQLLILEVVTKGPVTEHLKKSRVSIVTDLIDVLRAETLLAIGNARACTMCLSQKVRQYRLHARPCKERRRIILRYERGGWHDGVAARFIKFQIFCSHVVYVHMNEASRMSAKVSTGLYILNEPSTCSSGIQMGSFI